MQRTFRTKLRRFRHRAFNYGPKSWATRRVIANFADKAGLVYFGSVNQHNDEHNVIRGFTASLTHTDDHYCVGSFEGYDVMLVKRTDFVQNLDGSTSSHDWSILAITLQNARHIPHLFIKPLGHNEKAYNNFFATFPALKEAGIGVTKEYGQDFLSRFKIYVKPSHSIEVEDVINEKTARTMGAHFWPRSAEINDNMLYIYDNSSKITNHSLSGLMKSGIWLAQQLDEQD